MRQVPRAATAAEPPTPLPRARRSRNSVTARLDASMPPWCGGQTCCRRRVSRCETAAVDHPSAAIRYERYQQRSIMAPSRSKRGPGAWTRKVSNFSLIGRIASCAVRRSRRFPLQRFAQRVDDRKPAIRAVDTRGQSIRCDGATASPRSAKAYGYVARRRPIRLGVMSPLRPASCSPSDAATCRAASAGQGWPGVNLPARVPFSCCASEEGLLNG